MRWTAGSPPPRTDPRAPFPRWSRGSHERFEGGAARRKGALRGLALSNRGHILVYVRRVLSREVVLFRHILTQSIHLKPSLNSQRAHCQRVWGRVGWV